MAVCAPALPSAPWNCHARGYGLSVTVMQEHKGWPIASHWEPGSSGIVGDLAAPYWGLLFPRHSSPLPGLQHLAPCLFCVFVLCLFSTKSASALCIYKLSKAGGVSLDLFGIEIPTPLFSTLNSTISLHVLCSGLLWLLISLVSFNTLIFHFY